MTFSSKKMTKEDTKSMSSNLSNLQRAHPGVSCNPALEQKQSQDEWNLIWKPHWSLKPSLIEEMNLLKITQMTG